MRMTKLYLILVVVLAIAVAGAWISCSCGDDDDTTGDDDHTSPITATDCSALIDTVYMTCGLNINSLEQSQALADCTAGASANWVCIKACVDATPEDCATITTCANGC